MPLEAPVIKALSLVVLILVEKRHISGQGEGSVKCGKIAAGCKDGAKRRLKNAIPTRRDFGFASEPKMKQSMNHEGVIR